MTEMAASLDRRKYFSVKTNGIMSNTLTLRKKKKNTWSILIEENIILLI